MVFPIFHVETVHNNPSEKGNKECATKKILKCNHSFAAGAMNNSDFETIICMYMHI